MSTFTGQSLLHPLQAKQRSRASFTSSLRQPPCKGWPSSISKSRRARPRVECCSSRVTMKLGHMVPPSMRRHAPTPTQRGGKGKTALVVREPEMRFKLRWVVRGTKTQVFVHTIGVHYLTRVHLAVRIPDGLKFLEGCDQFWSKHFWQEFGARLAVTVFS